MPAAFYQARERMMQKMHAAEYHRPIPEIPPSEYAAEVKISILVPTFETPEEFLREMIESVLAQSYDCLELCIADGSVSNAVEDIVREYQDVDSRIVYRHLTENKGISENTNAALALASGEYVALLDHDDFLEPDALYQFAKAFDGKCELFYSDEDKVDSNGTVFHTPHYKQKFNLDLFLSNNYICHLFLVKTEIARKVGGFHSDFDGAQDYDFILRCVEASSPDRIVHIPKVLYHWRAHEMSTAENPESKMYAYEAGIRVLQEYLKRHGLSGTVEQTHHLGFYRINYCEPQSQNYVIVIREDLKPLNPDYEKIFASYFSRPEVGAVGGRIIGRNGRVVCDGYRKNAEGTIEAVNAGMNRHDSGYMHRAVLQQDVEAVSKHAIIVRKEFAPDIKNLKSYQLCQKIREAGCCIVLDPLVQFRIK